MMNLLKFSWLLVCKFPQLLLFYPWGGLRCEQYLNHIIDGVLCLCNLMFKKLERGFCEFKCYFCSLYWLVKFKRFGLEVNEIGWYGLVVFRGLLRYCAWLDVLNIVVGQSYLDAYFAGICSPIILCSKAWCLHCLTPPYNGNALFILWLSSYHCWADLL